jgi:hypothetical protein
MSVNKLIGQRRSLMVDPVATLVGKVAQLTASRNMNDKQIGQLVIATESMSDADTQQLTSVYNNFETTLRASVQDSGIAVEAYQLEAATLAGMMGTDPMATMSARPRALPANSVVMSSGAVDSYSERAFSMEAYDERENRNAQMNSIVYNLLSSRQDEFGETLFPTIIASPNEVGVTIAMKLFFVFNDFKRSATGALANYNRKNLIRAYADVEILKNELTRVVPVLRSGGSDANLDKFVDVTEVPSYAEALGMGVLVPTGALKVDTKIDLIAISQTNELLQSGVMGPTDALDTFIKLDKLFVKIVDGADSDIFEMKMIDLPQAVFTYAPQGNSRRMILNMDTDSLVLSNKTTKINGTALAVLTELATHKARIQLTIGGNVSLDKGDCSVNRGQMSLVALRNAANQLVTGATFADFAAKIAECEIIGYTLQAFRANSNLRQRGQLVDTQTEYRIIPVNLRSPLSILAPTARDSSDDTAAIQTLITATGVRASNEAVNALVRTEVTLENYSPVADASGTLPEMSAIGHFLVKPTFFKDTINLGSTVDSVKSHERIKDIRAALVEKIRYYANEMFRASEYQAASAVMTGNTSGKPTVIVATDPVLHNYLTSDGDLRTLGESFDVVCVSTLASPIVGKIYITFGVFDQSRNTAINPLNFGNMLYTPELVLNLPISRDGQVSKELTVTPRFTHIVNLPVLTALTVTGLPGVTGKVTVNMRTVS